MKQTQLKILILRLSSIGDILLSSSFIRQVRIQFPNAEIDFVIKKQFYDLVKYNPHLNTIYAVDGKDGIRGLLKLRNRLDEQGYSYVFDLHNNMRTRIITSLLKDPKKSSIQKDKKKRAILVYTKVNLLKNHPSIPERYLKVGKPAGVTDDNYGLELFWKDHVEKTAKAKLYDYRIRNNYIVIAPGAGFFSKRWPTDYLKELVTRVSAELKEDIIVVGGPDDVTVAMELSKIDGVTNLSAKLSLMESAAIINRARCVISNDSGVMHMATAVQTPVIAIFGSTVKELGFFPYRSKNVVLENKEIKCRPCSHIGRKRCPLGHFKCMKAITPDIVFNHLEAILKA